MEMRRFVAASRALCVSRLCSVVAPAGAASIPITTSKDSGGGGSSSGGLLHLNLSGVDPHRAFSGRPISRSQLPGYHPLSTAHPAFGLRQTETVPPPQAARHRLLSTDHPAFGTRRTFSSADCFDGPVSVSGFFLAIDPNFTAGSHDSMNPNAQLTIRDTEGNMARVRYRCHLVSDGGLKLEALIRFQVGWVSPKVHFSRVPYVILLGKGFDLSVPYLFHFTMVSVLDEHGDNSGSTLYFSGTPMFGFSAGWNKLSGGKLILNPSREVNPYEAEGEFVGHVHYRQLGFLLFKASVYVICFLACIPAAQRLLQYCIPDPFHRHSEKEP